MVNPIQLAAEQDARYRRRVALVLAVAGLLGAMIGTRGQSIAEVLASLAF